MKEKTERVEICVNNILLEYHVYLENLNLGVLKILVKEARRMALLVRQHVSGRRRNEVPHTMYVEIQDTL